MSPKYNEGGVADGAPHKDEGQRSQGLHADGPGEVTFLGERRRQWNFTRNIF